jgi:hypothetical protein
MRTALVFHGPQGTGKNLFFEAVMAIYGEYGRIVDQAAIEDKFNDWASRKLLMIADEVVARQELYHVKNKLKSFVTGEWIRINPKNVAAHTERNCMNLVFLSNERQPLVLEGDDRRHCVIWVPPKPEEEFFSAVNEEIDNGGVEALHHYLLTLDIGAWRIAKNNPKVKSRFSAKGFTLQDFASQLLNPSIKINLTAAGFNTYGFDNASQTKTAALGAECWVHHTSEAATAYDPSFAKTFATRKELFNGVGIYRDESCASDVYFLDWTALPKVISTALVRRLAIS